MKLGRLCDVLVVGAGALVSGACATTGAGAQSGEVPRLPDGGVVPPPPPPTVQPGGGPSGW